MKQEEQITAAGQVHAKSGFSSSTTPQNDIGLTLTYERMQDIINTLPGGVAIYRASEIFEAVYFSDGVAALTGYSVEEYRKLAAHDAALDIYPDDRETVIRQFRQALSDQTAAELDFRKLHRDGHIVWVYVQAKQIREVDGLPLLQCVFHDITILKETRFEMDHLINSIPGGIASYTIEQGRFIPTYFSDGVLGLSGHSRQEFEHLIKDDALDILYEADRKRVLEAAMDAVLSGEVLDVSYRMRHKNGNLIWIHLNGRRMGPLAESMRFYAVFTGMSAETHLYQSIANESADGIYVISKENYDLLYINDSKGSLAKGSECLGQKCYAALHGNEAPCAICPLKGEVDEEIHELAFPAESKIFATHCRETDWNGVPAYIQYVQDVTETVKIRLEKERLEQYFQTIVKNIPNGISVTLYETDGSLVPEFISDGLAALLHMPVERIYDQYRKNILKIVHPDEAPAIRKELKLLLNEDSGRCELTGRMLSGEGGYVWVKVSISLLPASGTARRLYASYTDISKTMNEKEQFRLQYDDMIVQHYHTPDPNTLLVAHSNITKNKLLRVIDHSGNNLLNTFGTDREEFYSKIAGQIEDEQARQRFLGLFLRQPILAAFKRNETEHVMECFVERLRIQQGVYAEFKLKLLEAPDSGDITGILTVTNITEQVMSQRFLHQLSVIGYDLVVDVDLFHDSYQILSCNEQTSCIPADAGSHSHWVGHMLRNKVVPRDREQYRQGLEADHIFRRLKEDGPYTFAFSILDDNGDTRTKNMTVSAIDLKLGRVCLSRSDITDSVREQQGLLNMVAYTFEVAGFINLCNRRTTLYTRQTVLENLPPRIVDDYNISQDEMFASYYQAEETSDLNLEQQFELEYITERLNASPAGYDFVLPYHEEGESLRYKQINVMWGDTYCKTICMVRADVTDILLAERKTQNAMEEALAAAEEANRAKSDFLSSMSHDIRTPMNAIIGMTTIALANLDDPDRISDCLKKISISSKHLLSLVNDVLDMNKIERSQITLNPVKISLSNFLEQLSAIIGSQARSAGLKLNMQMEQVIHNSFYGDTLRLNQIMLNLLSNAVKFTPENGNIELLVEEISPASREGYVCYQFTVRDTGIGISPEFLGQIFQPFTRGVRAAYLEGTGLGLSIAKGLVDLMDGRITVHSIENKGTAFHVKLEFEVASDKDEAGDYDEAHNADYSLISHFADRRFLIVEDNSINAEILSELLKMHGGSSVVVTNGAQAVEAFHAASPGTYDAILMDIQMPEMNGYEATRVIRRLKRNDAGSIPIIAMTANAFAEDVRAALDAGMNAHVAKPVDMGLLTTVLTRIFHMSQKR